MTKVLTGWLAWAMLTIAAPTAARGQVLFEEVTSVLGTGHIGQSWGASWGDLDGDGWPDLYVSNHGADPSLYRNAGDGSFWDSGPALGLEAGGDAHGAAWGDFDNDGDQDLIQIHGGVGGWVRRLRTNSS